MTRLSVATLLASVAMIVAAAWFELSFATGASGVLLIVGLSYSYVVATREAKLLSYAMEERDAERFGEQRPFDPTRGRALDPAE